VRTEPAAEERLRELAPQLLGALVRRFRNFDAAEDAAQEALLEAAQKWPHVGQPDNPLGWLVHVATRRLIDVARNEQARRRREELVFAREQTAPLAPPTDDGEASDRDDTLALFFRCCHPALTSASAIALTLRAVGGLTTAEIARAFLVPEATMAQRIARAKERIKSSGLPFQMPTRDEWPQRLSAVMHVLYLIFNEGYASSEGKLPLRVDLSSEAIRLARLLHRALPEDPEATGLLALMLLTDARRPARVSTEGELVSLAEQDRTKWDRRVIDEGIALISEALPRGSVGPYQLQAAIAALHDEAPSTETTDWPQILALYGLLAKMSDNPMVKLNLAIAAAMVHGPEDGLKRLQAIEGEGPLRSHHRLDSVKAHLLEMAGDHRAARELYHAAAARTTSLPEQRYLLTRAARLAKSQPKHAYVHYQLH
jgi:RNA polymerase sigma factor (sigma-70 family)